MVEPRHVAIGELNPWSHKELACVKKQKNRNGAVSAGRFGDLVGGEDALHPVLCRRARTEIHADETMGVSSLLDDLWIRGIMMNDPAPLAFLTTVQSTTTQDVGDA